MSISHLPNSSSSTAIASSQENEFDSFITRRRLGGNRFGTAASAPKLSDEAHGDAPGTRLPPIRPIPVRDDMSQAARPYYQDDRQHMDYEHNGDHAKRRRLSPPPATHTVKGGAFTPINPNRQVTPTVPSPPLEPSRSQSQSPDTNSTLSALAAGGRQMPRFRRKKRDTKPPNNDVRSVVDVAKDENGHYILPVEVDSWTVYDLGKVVWDRPAFHNQRYIYPVGYRVKK